MKRIAATLAVAAALTGVAPTAALAAPSPADACTGDLPLPVKLIPFC